VRVEEQDPGGQRPNLYKDPTEKVFPLSLTAMPRACSARIHMIRRAMVPISCPVNTRRMGRNNPEILPPHGEMSAVRVPARHEEHGPHRRLFCCPVRYISVTASWD